MPVSKQTRRSRHEQAENPTLDRGNPASSEGRVGTQQFRKIPGKGLVHLVRDDTGWKEMGVSQASTSKGDKTASSVSVAAGVSASDSVSQGTSMAGSSHSSLTNLTEDDHTHYVHNTTARTISADHSFSGSPSFSNINVNGGDIASETVVNKSPVVTLAGDLGGNATFTNLGNATLTATIQPNSVALTTDTTGNYMVNVTGNSQVSVSHSQAEGSTAALSIANDSIGDTQLAYNTGQHLTSSSAVTFATVDTGQGANELYDMNQNVLTTSSPQFSNMTFGEYSDPNYSNGEIGTSTFASGFVGTGWKMSKSGNEYNFETNNMLIRGTLSVYELLIQQVRATNGAIFVSSAAKVESSSGLSASDDDGTITFEDPSNNNLCPFAANDLIMMQRVNPGALVAKNAAGGDTSVIKKLVYKVASVSGKTITVENGGYNNTSSPSEGDDFVRIGNTSNSARQGIIYLTSDDSNSPYIDIKSDIDSYSDWTGSTPKVRLGKLDGITDNDAGLDGSQSELYGLYSDTVRLKGHIHATSGKIGGINMASSKIYTGTGTYNNSNTPFYVDSSSNFSLGDKLAWNNSTLSIDGTVVIGSTAASAIESKANSANQDSTASIRSGTTKANVGLSNVEDKSSASIRGEITKANVTDTGLGKGDIGLGNVDNTSDSSVLGTAATAANNATKTAGYVGGWQISNTSILGIADGSAQIVMTASGNIATGQWSINRDGSASFANGGITFATNGDITSNTYLIERTRLFGNGADGVIVLYSTSNDASVGRVDAHHIKGATDSNILDWITTSKWQLQKDLYADNLTIKSGVILYTKGYRIFCKGTLTIESGAAVYNLGSTATNQSGAVGGAGGTLSAGTDGKNGGNGGEGTNGQNNRGGYGGGAGGSGGIVLISARYISNSGTIAANGGNGAAGQGGYP
jgi:hypothetical protein